MKYKVFLSIAITIMIACIAGIIFLYINVVQTWNDVAVRQQKLDAAPAETIEIAKMKKEFTAAQQTFSSLQKMTVQRDALPDVVTAIMKAGTDSGVVVQVPEVSQNTVKGSPASDSLQDVRMHISASGSPAALIGFLYRLEQLPYLLYLASWNIDTTHQVSLSAFSGVAPTATPIPAAPEGSSLETDIIISTMK